MKYKSNVFEKLARKATIFSGSTIAFMIALFVILLWLISGAYFKFSESWLLLLYTVTTIITFLMMFLIQRTQNKDSRAIHLKLNELVSALDGPSSRLINIEDLSEEELETLSAHYRKLAEMAKIENKLFVSHSIEEAVELHKARNKSEELNH